MGTAMRYSWHNKKRIDVPEPSIIRSYNKGMGGVHVLDRLLSSYRPQLRSKKWWWNLFASVLNMAVVSAWQLHRELYRKTSKGHLEFRREVTMALLRTQPRVGSGPGRRVQIPISIRKTDGHYLTDYKQVRCVECKSNASLQCHEYSRNIIFFASPSSMD
jgi:hypothetical protein